MADVENNPKTNRRGFAGEISDLLLDLVFEQLKVFGLQVGDEPVIAVGDGDIEQHQVHIDFQSLLCAENSPCRDKHDDQSESLASKSHTMPRTLSLPGNQFKWFLNSTARLKPAPNLGLR